MKNIKLIASMLLGVGMGLSVTSCLNSDDPYRAGFSFIKPTTVRTNFYANNTNDTLIVRCLGPWMISTSTPDASWCQIESMQGKGDAIYSLGVTFEPNMTGRSRLVQFTIRDTDHPDEAYSSWQYLQYATRGDGSLGNAALVKSITSSDGYRADIEYDDKARPIKYARFNLNGDGQPAEDQLTINYNERDGQLTVNMSGYEAKGSMDSGYQTENLLGSNDTIGYRLQYYGNGMPISSNYAFNFVAGSGTRGMRAYSYLLNGQSLAPDSVHNADSLKYRRQWKNSTEVYSEALKLEYSKMDNRCQSVDVNHLLLGFAECHPLQLLSMFRYTRNTNIIARALSKDGSIEVTTELNPDKSVKHMVVKDARKGTEVTYDFTY